MAIVMSKLDPSDNTEDWIVCLLNGGYNQI